MKRWSSLLVLLAFSNCEPRQVPKNCQEKPRDERGCYALYDPVCGCNGKTYSNSCEALAVGITDFSKGACREN
ncbi:hypothetical protein GCM10027275_39300 [Rhabdobacter roseus]|uniref:Kazal-like domain-containing protein n=1 Tax=Rhabdobacter roseus TaxID=1655419 RepID=A0A840TRU3_9BACT|nr:protease inhibitor Kazal-type [Rhabdobacter roseus]MBB5285635.1 hypothetical protein [Rhabdobacter roseus]